MLKAVFFDLDGTLLPMDEQAFIGEYFKRLAAKVAPYGFEGKSFIGNVWKATKAMFVNDGGRTNEQVFWDCFSDIYGAEVVKYKEVFDEFYTNEFKEVKSSTGENPLAKEIVKFCKENFEYVFLTTNPVFPKVGTVTRMGFVGLEEGDFDYISAYENSSFCKPNPKYFEEILDRFSLKADEVLLFGNNETEDGECAAAMGIKVYMTGECLINDTGRQSRFPYIEMNEIITFLKNMK